MKFMTKFYTGEERHYSLSELVQYLQDDEGSLPVEDKYGATPLQVLFNKVE